MKITDEAVKAAANKLVDDLDYLMNNSEGVTGLHQNGDVAPWSEISKGGALEDWLSSHEKLRSVLQDAPSHLPAGFEVKELKWVEVSYGFLAHTPFGIYKISDQWSDKIALVIAGSDLPHSFYLMCVEAKAAAQADFERRVRECIVDGVDVAEVRRQAFEEALQAIADLPTPYSLANKDGREDCCDVIRALSAAPNKKDA